MDAFSQCMLPCKQMGLRARLFLRWTSLPLWIFHF